MHGDILRRSHTGRPPTGEGDRLCIRTMYESRHRRRSSRVVASLGKRYGAKNEKPISPPRLSASGGTRPINPTPQPPNPTIEHTGPRACPGRPTNPANWQVTTRPATPRAPRPPTGEPPEARPAARPPASRSPSRSVGQSTDRPTDQPTNQPASQPAPRGPTAGRPCMRSPGTLPLPVVCGRGPPA